MVKTVSECNSIYVHIPFCKARCGYCAFSSCTNFSLQKQYFDVLCNEISHAQPAGKIATMFWGGGTPSSVEISYLQQLFNALDNIFDFSELQEFTVECNPESTTEELLLFFKGIGVNRLSFGLQSVNNDTLNKIGRLHSFEKFVEVLNLAHRLGFENVNVDLILGLPESKQQFQNSVNVVASLPLSHISLYALEVHENHEQFKKLCQAYNYSEDELADMYDYAVGVFAAHGFARYEVSNFAKVGKHCKHNCVYWTENRYFGFGAAASGFVGNVRYGNAFDIRAYVESGASALEYYEEIDIAAQMAEYVMLSLRLADGILLQDFSDRFQKDFFAEFPAAEMLIARGFLCNRCGRVFVPTDKFYVLNAILVDLLPDTL